MFTDNLLLFFSCIVTCQTNTKWPTHVRSSREGNGGLPSSHTWLGNEKKNQHGHLLTLPEVLFSIFHPSNSLKSSDQEEFHLFLLGFLGQGSCRLHFSLICSSKAGYNPPGTERKPSPMFVSYRVLQTTNKSAITSIKDCIHFIKSFKHTCEYLCEQPPSGALQNSMATLTTSGKEAMDGGRGPGCQPLSIRWWAVQNTVCSPSWWSTDWTGHGVTWGCWSPPHRCQF